MVFMPSHLPTVEQAAMVWLVTANGYGLRYEVNDPLVAVGHLARA